MTEYLSKDVVTQRIKPDGSTYAVAAGTSNIASDIVDTAGYEGLRFILAMGAIVSGAATSCNLQQNSANSSSGMADLTGTNVTIADTDDNKLIILELNKPQERYIRMEILRATQNATVDGLIVELFNPRTKPVTQDSTVATLEIHQAPAEGTV